MANSKVHGLEPLLNWLTELHIMNQCDKDLYTEATCPPQRFFDELRNGYILSKLAVTAVPHGATAYRADLCTTANTRYVRFAVLI